MQWSRERVTQRCITESSLCHREDFSIQVTVRKPVFSISVSDVCKQEVHRDSEIHEQVQVSWKVWWWWWGDPPTDVIFDLFSREHQDKEKQRCHQRGLQGQTALPIVLALTLTNNATPAELSGLLRRCSITDFASWQMVKKQRKNWNEWHFYKAAKYIIDDSVLLTQLSYHMVAILPSGVKNSKVQPILQRHRKFRSSLLICAHHVLCYNNQNNL